MIVIFVGVTVLATLIHWLAAGRGEGRLLQLAARHACLFLIGLGGVWAFVGHTFRPDDVAKLIGWPPGNPFQFEVGMADLAFGLLGILAFRFGGGFRVASAIGWAIFLIGDGIGHLRQLAVVGNTAPLNAGAGILIGDLAIPFFVLALVVVAERSARAATANAAAARHPQLL